MFPKCAIGKNTRTRNTVKYMETIPQVVTRFSHIVIFWTDPSQPNAADKVIAGGNKFLKNIPSLTHFHIGKMVASARPVVDQTYQVALNTVFTSKQAQDDYQVHRQHLEFIAQCVKPFVKKVAVYDFE
jgi:hypothetical protein